MTEQQVFLLIMGLAFIFYVWRCVQPQPRYRTKYMVREYENMEDFEDGVNAASQNGWEMESWETEPLYDWETIKAREGGTIQPPGHSSFQIYRVIYTKEVRA
jgi:hypothetical protein